LAIDNGKLSGTGPGGGVGSRIFARDESWTGYSFKGKAIFGIGNAQFVLRSAGIGRMNIGSQSGIDDLPS
jgi:hypothetical protein